MAARYGQQGCEKEAINARHAATVVVLTTCTRAHAQARSPARPISPPPYSTQEPNPAPGRTSAFIVDQQTIDTVTGGKVLSATGEDLGRLNDVMVEANGQGRAAIVDFGGVLDAGAGTWPGKGRRRTSAWS
ncbi:PRC-barrel domain-containing protein [Telmatospirillum sp.]|uniref:PRC-barrel domain-containing protein n=1 Tax=Telmatospirillum sp. TaxID=2079197 RepID=UPI0038650470